MEVRYDGRHMEHQDNLSIQIGYVPNPDAEERGHTHLMVLDGQILTGEQVEVSLFGDEPPYAKILDEDVSARVAELTCAGLRPLFRRIVLSLGVDEDETAFLELVAVVDFGERPLVVEFFYRTYPEHWKSPWSIAEFADMAKGLAAGPPFDRLRWMEDAESGDVPILLNAVTPPIEASVKLQDALDQWTPLVRRLKEQTLDRLASQQQDYAVTAHFDFPDEYRVACGQYLLYFAEFLNDLGVAARANLSYRGAEVILTVIPDSPDQALESIRDALAVYLRLPEHPGLSSVAVVAGNPSIQGLAAAVHHLRSQVELANAKIQLKDATTFSSARRWSSSERGSTEW